jgi:hypothetical protein
LPVKHRCPQAAHRLCSIPQWGTIGSGVARGALLMTRSGLQTDDEPGKLV